MFNATVLGIYIVGFVVPLLAVVVNVNLYRLLPTKGTARFACVCVSVQTPDECVYTAVSEVNAISQVLARDVQPVRLGFVSDSAHRVVQSTFNVQLFSMFITSFTILSTLLRTENLNLEAIEACAFSITHWNQSIVLLAVSRAVPLVLFLAGS